MMNKDFEHEIREYTKCPLQIGDKVKYHGKYKEDYTEFDYLIVTGVYIYKGEVVVNCLCPDEDEAEFYYDEEGSIERIGTIYEKETK
jgi:hypothetical protein